MSKRDRRAAQGLEMAESDNDTDALMSPEELTRTGYGMSLDEVDKGRMVAKPISIHDILPDPKQPRRQIPSVIRQQWDGYAATVGGMFSVWAAAFAEESGRGIEEIGDFIDQVLEGNEVSPAEVYQGDQADPKRQWGVIGGSLMAVVNLAAEIRRDGLTNPITVVRVGNQFVIETGERRWLAFHLLNIFYPDSKAWERIPARVIPTSSVWRQASENTARAQLNAISMARQLAILLMDLYGNDRFEPYYEMVQSGQCDRAYYAQVSDGNEWRVPRGKGEQLVSAMGKTGEPDVLRKYRDLLRLPDEAWMLADDLDWTENFIRTEIVQKAADESGKINRALFYADRAGYRVIEVGHTVTAVTVSDDEPEPAREEIPQANSDEGLESVQGDQRYSGNEAELALGGRGAPVRATSGQSGTLAFITGRIAHVDTANGRRQYDVNNLTRDEEVQPEAQSLPNLPYWVTQVLEFAYELAAAGKPFFAAKDSPSNPDRLNQMIASGWLKGRSAYTNADWSAAFYSISDTGCAAVGRPVPAYPHPGTQPQPNAAATLTSPVSAAAAHSGTSAAVSKTPPVQNNPDPNSEQRAMVNRMLAQMDSAHRQYEFTVQKFAYGDVTLPDLQAEVDVRLKKMMELIHSIHQQIPRNNA